MTLIQASSQVNDAAMDDHRWPTLTKRIFEGKNEHRIRKGEADNPFEDINDLKEAMEDAASACIISQQTISKP